MPNPSGTRTAKHKGAHRKHKADVECSHFDFETERQRLDENTTAHRKAKETTENYRGHIRRCKEWLRKFAADEEDAQAQFQASLKEGKFSTGEDEAFDGVENISADPRFLSCLDGPPNEFTPIAIAMYISHQCFEKGLSGGTAYSIYSAFLWHYDTLAGDKYRGKWVCDASTGVCRGNPARSAHVTDINESCQNKDGERERNHSKPMSLENMERIYAESLRKCPEGLIPQTGDDIELMAKHLYWRAFSSFAFVLWTRNFETTNVRYENIVFPGCGERPRYSPNPAEQVPYFTIQLTERKNWQNKMKKGEHQLTGNEYNIWPLPPSTTTPSIDLYKHLLLWLDFAEVYLLGRPWDPKDHVFPRMGKHARAHPDTAPTPDAISKMIFEMATAAGIANADKFTTHCFRRGGSQYRFMFAPVGQRWRWLVFVGGEDGLWERSVIHSYATYSTSCGCTCVVAAAPHGKVRVRVHINVVEHMKWILYIILSMPKETFVTQSMDASSQDKCSRAPTRLEQQKGTNKLEFVFDNIGNPHASTQEFLAMLIIDGDPNDGPDVAFRVEDGELEGSIGGGAELLDLEEDTHHRRATFSVDLGRLGGSSVDGQVASDSQLGSTDNLQSGRVWQPYGGSKPEAHCRQRHQEQGD
ncbi:hypothetical protein NMY22_g11852 [Coprinellus aureogranulatus]|nr:hypothetical protein NMY22_g11852 [Coprinellus aureogranulatus]